MYQFGPGGPIQSKGRWKYPVGINGKNGYLLIAEVDAPVPGLIGPDEMAQWGIVLDFTPILQVNYFSEINPS